MSINKSDWVCDLEKIENELNELLSMVKPEDKLKEGDIFEMKKDIQLIAWWIVLKWEILKINEIQRRGNINTISYTRSWKKWNLVMNESVFIKFFCELIVKEQSEFNEKILELRAHEKTIKNNIKNNELESLTEDIKEKVSFIIRLTKFLKKNVKLFN